MRHRMTGLKFEKANFILSTKEKLPIRQTAVSGIFMLISCVYHMFILYLSCVAKTNIIPVHEYSCRITDRDTSAFSYVGQMFKN